MPKIIEDEVVYQAVMQVVLERGYAGATTRQMANAAGISEVTLFRKYENKLQLVKQAMESIIAQTDFKAATQYTGNVFADLLRVVQAYQESAVKHGQFIFILLSELPRYPDLSDLLNTPLGIFAGISQLIAFYQAEGVLRQEHPMHALAALLGPLIYASMMQSGLLTVDIPPLDLERHIAHFLAGRQDWSSDQRDRKGVFWG